MVPGVEKYVWLNRMWLKYLWLQYLWLRLFQRPLLFPETLFPETLFPETTIIPRDQLPYDAADWTDVSVSFPRLAQDTAESCPRPEDEIFEHVEIEAGDVGWSERQRLRFIRSALVAEAKYWLWEYREDTGELRYVALRLNPDRLSVRPGTL